jgi:hypothetical protein
MTRYEKRRVEKVDQKRRQVVLDQQFGKGRGVRRQAPQTCICGGGLTHQHGDVWRCKQCGKTIVTAPFATFGKMCDVVYADEKEVLNLDGAVVFKGKSKSGKRRKKPKSKLHDYFEI